MAVSREVQSIVNYVKATGLPHKVTSTLRQPRFDGDKSRHISGLAVDFAGPTPHDVKAMLAIYRALLGQAGKLHELIFWAPGQVDVLVRRRLKVVPLTYGTTQLNAHRNHVHVSVDRGTLLEVPAPVRKEVTPMFDPPIQIAAWCRVTYGGGGEVAVTPDGHVYCDPPDLYRGAPAGQPYWGDRRAAQIEPFEDRYRIIATTGEAYADF